MKIFKKIYNFISNLHWTGDGKGVVEHRWCYLHHYCSLYKNGDCYSYGKLFGIKFNNKKL